jgi:hypothetical protein
MIRYRLPPELRMQIAGARAGRFVSPRMNPLLDATATLRFAEFPAPGRLPATLRMMAGRHNGRQNGRHDRPADRRRRNPGVAQPHLHERLVPPAQAVARPGTVA